MEESGKWFQHFQVLTPTQNKLEGLLRGEEVHTRTYSTYHSRSGPHVGTFYLTNFRVIFIRHIESLQTPYVHIKNSDARIQLGKIFKISKYAVLQDIVLEIWCKDFQLARFSFISDGKACDKLHKALHRLTFPPSIDRSFAFHYKSENAEFDLSDQFDGWNLYNPVKEYARLGIPDTQWRISESNDYYKLCSSYPRTLVVPAKITDSQLKEASNFRMRERIPAFSWRHPNTKAALTRSSQPRVGWGRTRSSADEDLIAAIRLANLTQPSLPLLVVDARSKMDAVAHQAMGAGCEGLHYEHTKLQFMGICNAFRVAEAANKLMQLVHTDDSAGDWLVKLSSTRWLEYISLVISAAVKMTQMLEKGNSVHVHCSDGWDRTAQLVSLAMLLSDPYYRTLEGVAVLVEKEWLSFGHKFEDRLGHASIDHASKERSPVFLQWIDCVYQLIAQFPTAFEFNDERHRVKAMLSDRTTSFWYEVHTNKHSYTNVYYNYCPGTLQPMTECRFLKFWTGFYLRWSVPTAHHLEMSESDAKILQNVKDKQNLQQVLSQSYSVNEDLREKMFSLANDNMKMNGEVNYLWQKLDSLLDLIHRGGDKDMLTRAETVVGRTHERELITSSEGILRTSGGSNEKSDVSNNDSGYLSDHEEYTIDANTNHTNTRRKVGILGRSLSDAPMPVDLLERRRITRSNSDVAKETKKNVSGEDAFEIINRSTDEIPTSATNPDNHSTTENNDPPVKGPMKTHVRTLLVKSNHSISSDDNDNDEREAARPAHMQHGARRWRQIQCEKNTLQEENAKLKDANQELLMRLTTVEKMLANEKEASRRLAASKKSLIHDLTNILLHFLFEENFRFSYS